MAAGGEEGFCEGLEVTSAVNVCLRQHLDDFSDFVAGDPRELGVPLELLRRGRFVVTVDASGSGIPVGADPLQTGELRRADDGPKGGGVDVFLGCGTDVPADSIERHKTEPDEVYTAGQGPSSDFTGIDRFEHAIEVRGANAQRPLPGEAARAEPA